MSKALVFSSCLLAASLLAMSPSWSASVDAKSTVYAVQGVSADDSLNLREGPGTNNAIIARLPYNGRGVVSMGEEQSLTKTNWVKVAWAGRQGWVNKRYLTTVDMQGRPVSSSAVLTCTGAKPFWRIKVDEHNINVMMPKGPKYNVKVDFRQQSANNTSIAVVGGHRGRAKTTAFLQRVGACSDGVSKKNYSYSVTALLNSYKVVSGCCALSGAN